MNLTVAAGTGALFPTVPPFNCTVWPTGVNPLSTNAEIIGVTNVAGDLFTITRAQEGSTARAIVAGDQIANTITIKCLTDIEASIISVNDFFRQANYGGVAPVWVPASGLGIAIDISTAPATIWWYYAGTWN